MKIVFHTAMLPELLEAWGTRQPLGFGYLAAYLRQTQPDVAMRLAHTEEELLAERADVAALSAVTFNYGQARTIAQKVKKAFGAVVVLGGPHVTAMPEGMHPEFDFGVVGEGEETFRQLVERLAERRPPEGLEAVEGLVFWRDGQRIVNPPRELIEPIDSLPFPDRGLFGEFKGPCGGAVSMITSRGCPFDCLFCSSTMHWRRLRAHSAGYVVGEIDEVVARYRPPFISFEDDLFVADRKRLAAMAEEILRRGYPQRIGFQVSARSNLLTEEVCALLKSINTTTVFVGFESNSDKTLRALGKSGVSAAANQRAVDNVVRAGMKLVGSFILGAPGETRDDAHETFQFIHRNLDAFASFMTGVLRLLPGTAFWKRGLERGLIDENLTGIVFDRRDFDGWFSLNERYPMLCETMTRGELVALLLAFDQLRLCHRERVRAQGLEQEAAALRSKNIDALGIKQTSRALGRKLARRLAGRFVR